ncbi:oligosaccharide flippase family protein [Salinarimonas sp.]|uniref:oligosaccharide flippase family protein n=1 Tax=Salinarimonas sp. TaxID=2766526 RepID=UPI0032D98A2D
MTTPSGRPSAGAGLEGVVESSGPPIGSNEAGLGLLRRAALPGLAGAIAELRGAGLFARAARSSGIAAAGHLGSQGLRLAANLVLTRLLFPHDFGLMALVSVVVIGLAMVSDVGLGPAIMASRRGDDRRFLDTAWTIQIARGVLLWLLACGLAVPAAHFYGEPMLAAILPVAALSLLVAGFNPTRIESANRHLLIGRVTLLDLASQVLGVLTMVALAFATGSVWALAVGGVAGAIAKLALTSALLPGPANRLCWDRGGARELVRFGAWIFLGTICGFLATQGDKLFLGKFLTMEELGVYNIAAFLAGAPLMLGGAVTGRVLIPLYRDCPPAASVENFRKLRRMRCAITATLCGLLALLALGGPALIDLLYDPRYAAAGPIVTLIAIVLVVQAIVLTYDQAALAAGETRRFFHLVAVRAVLFSGFFLAGLSTAGLCGALLGQLLATLCFYPFVARLAHRYGVWDPSHDGLFLAGAAVVATTALWLNREAVLALALAGLG